MNSCGDLRNFAGDDFVLNAPRVIDSLLVEPRSGAQSALRSLRQKMWSHYVQRFLLRHGITWTGKMPLIDGAFPVVTCWGEMHFGTDCVIRTQQSPVFFRINGNARLEIGSRVGMSCGVRIAAAKSIVIEDHVLLGAFTTIYDSDSHMVGPLSDMVPRPVTIKRNAWLGHRSTILKGVTVGEHSVVASGSVVHWDVPPKTIVGGVPARPIGMVECPDDWVRP